VLATIRRLRVGKLVATALIGQVFAVFEGKSADGSNIRSTETLPP